jgi:hypothetical protein
MAVAASLYAGLCTRFCPPALTSDEVAVDEEVWLAVSLELGDREVDCRIRETNMYGQQPVYVRRVVAMLIAFVTKIIAHARAALKPQSIQRRTSATYRSFGRCLRCRERLGAGFRLQTWRVDAYR